MKYPDVWRPLEDELDRWQSVGKQAAFWVRDDDAQHPTDALEHLLNVVGAHAIPLTLAVIPRDTNDALARRLERSGSISVAVHGWSHENHAPIGEKKQELGRHRPPKTVLAELQAGVDKLSELYGSQFVSLLVPPWNRIDASLIPHLSSVGFTGLSVFGPEQTSSIAIFNTHVDLIDWKGTRGGRDPAVLVGEIVERLTAVFDTNQPVGVLTHHLVHDHGARAFLDQLFAITANHPACRWASSSDFLPS